MKLRTGLALLFVLAVPLAVDGQDPSVPPPTAEQKENARRFAMKVLTEQKLPKVEMDKLPVRKAVEFLCVNQHINLVLSLGGEDMVPAPAPPDVRNIPGLERPGIRGVPDVPAVKEPAEPLITIHRRNMPLKEFLDDVCKQSGLKWVIEYPGLIRITPKPK